MPVVASDLPGMAQVVRETGCGELVDPTDPADIARGIRAILDLSDGRSGGPDGTLRGRRPGVRLGQPGGRRSSSSTTGCSMAGDRLVLPYARS